MWGGEDTVEFGACPTCESYEPAGAIQFAITPGGRAERRRCCAYCGTEMTNIFPVPLPRWVAEEALRRRREQGARLHRAG